VQQYPTFVSHLECGLTGRRYPADTIHGLSEAGRPLLVRYDLPALAKAIDRGTPATRGEGGFWRYREMLPVRRSENVVSLGEVMTPLIDLPRTAARLGAARHRAAWRAMRCIRHPASSSCNMMTPSATASIVEIVKNRWG